MKLQKMNYYGSGLGNVLCAVDKGGEFTICGNNCIDAGRSEHDDWDIIGGFFEGTLKKVTCPNCLDFIRFIKNMK
jgi:hypothetical protein